MSRVQPNKRPLKYSDCDEMLADVRDLLHRGYVPHGNWTLGQACSHVADWMRFPVDGFPQPPWIMGMMFWVMKHTVGPGMKRKILAEGFRPGMPTAPETVPTAGQISDQAGFEKLEQTVSRVTAHDGPLHPSPLFGEMDKPTLIQVTLLHAEHHFGYLEPKLDA